MNYCLPLRNSRCIGVCCGFFCCGLPGSHWEVLFQCSVRLLVFFSKYVLWFSWIPQTVTHLLHVKSPKISFFKLLSKVNRNENRNRPRSNSTSVNLDLGQMRRRSNSLSIKLDLNQTRSRS